MCLCVGAGGGGGYVTKRQGDREASISMGGVGVLQVLRTPCQSLEAENNARTGLLHASPTPPADQHSTSCCA
jgi:hypothetical protein